MPEIRIVDEADFAGSIGRVVLLRSLASSTYVDISGPFWVPEAALAYAEIAAGDLTDDEVDTISVEIHPLLPPPWRSGP